MHIRSPLLSLGNAEPAALAGRLLDEIEGGMVPVWPSTERYADRLVRGLEILQTTRGPSVLRAVVDAPRDTVLDWPMRLGHLTH